jgi:hypothetical protein
MLTTFDDEEVVEGCRLAVDFRAIAHIERMTGKTMPEILPELFGACPISLKAQVVKGFMLRHYPDATLDQALSLVTCVDPTALFGLIQRTFNVAKERSENPPKRRGTLRPFALNGSSSAALLPSSGMKIHDPTSMRWKAWPTPRRGNSTWRFRRRGTPRSSRSQAMAGSSRISANISTHGRTTTATSGSETLS